MNQPEPLEFYANATLGFRQWHFSLADAANPTLLRGFANPLLRGLTKQGFDGPRYHWRLEGPNYAECSRLDSGTKSLKETHGEVPGVNCSCGFYAYDTRAGSNSETAVYMVGGVVAGWGNLELHERGFKCSVAKILALFEWDPDKEYADYDGVAEKQSAALERLCVDSSIPLLPPDALRDCEDVRQYARERDLALLKDQLQNWFDH